MAAASVEHMEMSAQGATRRTLCGRMTQQEPRPAKGVTISCTTVSSARAKPVAA